MWYRASSAASKAWLFLSCNASKVYALLPVWTKHLLLLLMLSFFLTLLIRSWWFKPGMSWSRRAAHNALIKILSLISGRKTMTCYYCGRIFLSGKSVKNGMVNKRYLCKRCLPIAADEARQVIKWNCQCKRHRSQRITFNGQCLNCYVEQWISLHKRRKSSLKTHVIRLLFGLKWAPTLRNSENSWSGDRVPFNVMLENNLKLNWCIYVKMYVNRKGILKPLVVGKSGSTAVNHSGCDLNFSTDINDGPARKFLKATNQKWYVEWILIKGVNNQKKAYKLESKIARIFDLYGS